MKKIIREFPDLKIAIGHFGMVTREGWLSQIALAENSDNSLQSDYYNITAETIIRIMELLDGYRSSDMGKVNITCKKTGEHLKNSPYIELHDVVCDYLKDE